MAAYDFHSPYQKMFLFRSIWLVLNIVSFATIKHDASNAITCGECDGRLRVVAYFALEIIDMSNRNLLTASIRFNNSLDNYTDRCQSL